MMNNVIYYILIKCNWNDSRNPIVSVLKSWREYLNCLDTSMPSLFLVKNWFFTALPKLAILCKCPRRTDNRFHNDPIIYYSKARYLWSGIDQRVRTLLMPCAFYIQSSFLLLQYTQWPGFLAYTRKFWHKLFIWLCYCLFCCLTRKLYNTA